MRSAVFFGLFVHERRQPNKKAARKTGQGPSRGLGRDAIPMQHARASALSHAC
jgi:hypothetical protein